jgi:DHA2 family multidrug resistance protein
VAGAPAPLAGSKLALVTVALAMANFMEVLDVTIANVSIPAISGDLGVSPNEGTWIITSYAVANAISVLTTGWLSQRFGQVKVFTWAVLLFTVASAGCGMSFTFPMLLFFRVFQGAVSGLMVPLSQALLLAAYPPAKRGIGMAIWGMTVTVAPVLGPIVGGLITDTIGWSWIFFINLPFGVGAALLTWVMLRDRESPIRRIPLDAVGFALVVIWVGCLQIMLDKGNDLDWFGSPFIVGLAVTSAVCCAAFLIWELTAANPLVNLRLFAIRNFTTATVAMALGYTVFFATIIVMPLWLETDVGYNATWAGLVVAPTGVLAVLLAPAVGKSMGKLDMRWLATIAFLVFAALSFWRSHYTSDASFIALAAPQFFQGIAVATFFSPLIGLALGSLDGPNVPAGSGLLNFLRMTAASFGASVAISLWDHRAASNQSWMVDHFTPSDPAYVAHLHQLQLLGISGAPARAAMLQEIGKETAVRSVDEIFWMSGWLFLAVIGFVWLVKRPRAPAMAGAH